MDRGARNWAAFFSGVAVGAVIGLLYAPDTGKNTRSKLLFQLKKYTGKLSETLERRKKAAATSEYDSLNAQDYRKVEDLLREVETAISDIESRG